MAKWDFAKRDSGEKPPVMDVEIDVDNADSALEDSACADMMEAIKKGDRKAFGAALKAYGEACGWGGDKEESETE